MKLIEIVTEALSPNHRFKAVIIVGPPGSGKSSIRRSLTLPSDIVVLDRDEFQKQQLSRRASGITLETSFADAVNSASPILADTVGSNEHLLSRRVTSLKRLGYDVKIIIVDVSESTSLERVKSRENVEHRTVDPEFIKAIHQNKAFVYGSLQRDFPDDVIIINNEKEMTSDQINTINNQVTAFFNTPVSNPRGRELLSKMDTIGADTIAPHLINIADFYKILGYSWYSRTSK